MRHRAFLRIAQVNGPGLAQFRSFSPIMEVRGWRPELGLRYKPPMMTPQQTKKQSAWMVELLATLTLSWPLVLTNLAQNALMTSDVLLMGWLGSDTLAAGALGTNLYLAFLIFGVGLVNATSPLIAEELGRKRLSVREVRRTVRQGFWASITVAVPIWIVSWNGGAILAAMGQEPALAKGAGDYMRALQWSLLPFLFSLVLRSFLAALERPAW